MTIIDLRLCINMLAGKKNLPQIEVFTNVGHPARLISIEYCEVNNVIMMKYETKG